MMSEKRKTPRSRRQENVYIEISVENDQQQRVKKIVGCESVDVSRDGLKLYVQEKVERGTILNLCLSFKDRVEKYFLVAEVRWSRPLVDEGWYYVGFELFAAESSDYLKWQQWVDEQDDHLV